MNTGDGLIDVQELDATVGSGSPSRLVLLDVRWRLGGPPPEEMYASGHLPAAVAVHLDRDLAAPVGDGTRGRHPLPEPAALQEALRRWGINEDSRVVAYDEADGTSAARAWWLLRWAGLEDVRVLDGGIAAWTAAGLPVTTELPSPRSGNVVVRPGAMPVLDAEGAAALIAGLLRVRSDSGTGGVGPAPGWRSGGVVRRVVERVGRRSVPAGRDRP